MSKWMKVDPATLKVGDRFKAVNIRGHHSNTVATGVVEDNDFEFLYDTTSCHWFIDNYQWYIRSNEPKKAKPEPGLVEGHTATHWHRRFLKQLNHNEQLQAVNSGRRVKMQRLEKEVKDACKDTQYWQGKYAVLAASINEVPDEPSPPTRPDEPPVGSFFRVDRTGFEFWRFASMEDGYGYWQISPRSEEPDWERWDDITDHGDTITLLELTEKGDKKDGGV